MRKRLNYDVLFTKGDQSLIWTSDCDLIDYLDYDQIPITADYLKNNKLVARSYRVNKNYLASLQKNYSKIY